MRVMQPRWDAKNSRWECSIGSGKNRKWFRCRIEGERGREIVEQKRDLYLHGPAPLMPGSLAEFIETVWWPRVKVNSTYATLKGYRGTLKNHIARFYGMKLDDIRLDQMQAWVNEMKDSPKSIHNRFRLLSGILELARLTGRYNCFDHKLVLLPEIIHTPHVDLTAEKVRKLVEAARGTELEGPVWAAGWLGLRRNEVCGLKRPHVVIHGETATVTVQDNRQEHGESRKLKSKRTGDTRNLEIPRFMAERLLSFGPADSLYLFNYQGKPIHPNRITKFMPELCEKAGIEKLTFHTLRAACRSNLKVAGASEQTIMRILGHTSHATSMLYQDVRAEATVEAFRMMLEYMEKA